MLKLALGEHSGGKIFAPLGDDERREISVVISGGNIGERLANVQEEVFAKLTRTLVGQTVAAVERDLILETLKHCLGNRTHAALILGISIRTLRNKLNEYASDGAPIPPPGGGEPPIVGPSPLA